MPQPFSGMARHLVRNVLDVSLSIEPMLLHSSRLSSHCGRGPEARRGSCRSVNVIAGAASVAVAVGVVVVVDVVAVVLTLLLQTVIVTSSLAVNSAHLPTKSPIALPRTKHPLV